MPGSYPIQLPHVGESVTEAVIGKWLVQVGDHVDKFDPIVEVVTDKVNMEYPAPEAGTITEIVAQEGDTVPMGALIASMDPDDPNVTAPSPDEAAAPSAGDGIGLIGEMITGANVGPTGGTFADTSVEPETPAGTTATTGIAAQGGSDRSGHYSPVVMRLAQQNGIDLSGLTGTGRGGRVTKQDVLRAIEGRSQQIDAAPASPEAPGEDRVLEPSPVRKIIAANMERSWREIPHAWTSVECDVTGLVRLRDGQKEYFRSRHGASLSYAAFSIHAAAAALRANPLANSAWIDGKIRQHGRVNIGLAVAAPDGLVVPVVTDADQKSVAELAIAIAPLVERARSGSLALQDVQGGTFTLNNTGPLGSVWGGAIINPPQAAILNTEAIVKRPVVVTDESGDSIAIRQMMNLSLSFDHRILDGEEASGFIQAVKSRLESFAPGTEIN